MVRSTILLLSFLFTLLSIQIAQANEYKNEHHSKTTIKKIKGDCVPATAKTYLDINNVRATLLNGGDMWWDLEQAGYVVPNTENPDTEVSSIFAGAIWMGGIDPAGNLKIGAVQYRGGSGNHTDYYPGPLDPTTGLTDNITCEHWDRLFSVYKSDILTFNELYPLLDHPGGTIDKNLIHSDILHWPAKGNSHFFEKYNFELPSTGQGLASFWDEDKDGLYDPTKGDFPILTAEFCDPDYRSEALKSLPDQMTFWVFNDSGGPHTESNGSTAIQMEVQATAFAYATDDLLNDATFYKFKFINRAPQDIRDMYHSLWLDIDLGCSEDDNVGCSPKDNLVYAYNQDAVDGDSGSDCSTLPGNTYGTETPLIGINLLGGPLCPKRFVRDEDGNIVYDENGQALLESIQNIGAEVIDTFVEASMSSFIYINRQSPNLWTVDPQTAPEYYNYMSGKWRDGRPITYGGFGYNGTEETNFVFSDDPDDQEGWSQCTNAFDSDQRLLMNTGPYLLTPGAVNELVYGVLWIPGPNPACPSIEKLRLANQKVQAYFDNCFTNFELIGPDAPDIQVLELDQSLVLNLNNPNWSNNAQLAYKETDPIAPEGTDREYRFEGYKIFQLISDDIELSEYANTDKVRMVRQYDINNDVTDIFNWTPFSHPDFTEPIWIPELKVEGQNQGIKHSVLLTEDAFTNQTFINGQEYYFSIVAYAHNEWQQFNPHPTPSELFGQSMSYLEGKRNVKIYAASPNSGSNTNFNFNYGDGICIDRLSGVGHNGHVIDLKVGQYDKILNGQTDGRLSYKEKHGPVEVKVVDPSLVINGTYNIVIDGDFNDIGSICAFEPGAKWFLYRDGELIAESDLSVDQFNEQIIDDHGLSVTVFRSKDAGQTDDDKNGAIDIQYSYQDNSKTSWYNAVTDDGYGLPFVDETPFFSPIFNFLKTADSEVDHDLDPDEAFSQIGNRQFYPFFLSSAAPQTPSDIFPYYLTPAWNQQGFIRNNNGLYKLNNVDIIFTNDKSKWSRCIVVETNNQFFENNGYKPVGDTATDNFDLRQSPSVDQNGNEDGDGLGMSWFPGYAVDVETGKRLNIFFGENSYYNEEYASENEVWSDLDIGADMLFNPNDQLFVSDSIQGYSTPRSLYAGAHHFIYVTSKEYDGCASFKEKITESTSPANLIGIREVLLNVTWCSMSLINQEVMLSYEDGYIPNDLAIKLRVNNPYNLENQFSFTPNQCDPIEELPTYEFIIENNGTSNVSMALNKDEKVILYPNPAEETITLKTDMDQQNASINILSLEGQQIISLKANKGNNSVIDISKLQAGVYILQFRSLKKTISQIFMKY